jgi:hypothetical protein
VPAAAAAATPAAAAAAASGLFTRLPGLRLAVPEAQIQWSDADKDVGLAALPVTWKVSRMGCSDSS